MEEEEVQYVANINCLPDEILIMILKNNQARDILNFGETNKRFHYLIKGHVPLWKHTCGKIFSDVLFKNIDEYHNGNWYDEVKAYSILKQNIITELISMSAIHYWKVSEKSLDNVHNFWELITKENYFYAINILQDIIKAGHKYIDKYECIKPYTLTETYYAKAALRHLMHSYLVIKWSKSKQGQFLSPALCLNYFLQWIDPARFYFDEDVHAKVGVLADQVLKILIDKRRSSGEYNDLQIIEAVSHVLYKQRRMALTTAADADTLDVCKVIDNKCGNVIVIAAIYQAVATRCGACCELIVFPNHLYLEWKDLSEEGYPLYNIDLGTGSVYPKRQCPFVVPRNHRKNKYSYCPDSLMQYIYSSYIITMGALRTWNTQNAINMLDFLGTIECEQSEYKHNPYKAYLIYMLENQHVINDTDTPNLYQLSDEHMEIIRSLAELNNIDEIPTKNRISKRHASGVKYAVGMLCYHKRYDYVCIIRGWDVTGCQLHFPLDDLYFGRSQPFYYITAADQSERYVAQENLTEVSRPTRLYHLEHQISQDFTHFDGFAYVLNDEKRFEYPEDQAIVEVFRSLCLQKPNNI